MNGFEIQDGILVKYTGKETDVIIPDSVTAIGNSAFRWCQQLQSVIIPSSVTSIGDIAFNGCQNLQSVIIPNSVTSIGDSAFSWCEKLQSVIMHESVTSIGDSAFFTCTSLQSVMIPNSVTRIGNSAFANCSSLQSVTLPNSVTSIGDSAFRSCEKLQSVTIPYSVTSVGARMFERCTDLQSVTIPDSVTSIGDGAFYACAALQSLTVPDSVTSIGSRAFENCAALQSVTIPDAVTSIGNRAFLGCKQLADTNGLLIVNQILFDYFGNAAHVVIPDTVTVIGTDVFDHCSSLQSVTIPSSVTRIGEYAFKRCSSLQSVTIPHSVTAIGDNAFYECSSLQSVTIPDSVTSIGYMAFYACALRSLTIPSSVTSIGNRTFENCSSLQSVTIMNAVTRIGNSTFENCSSLESVTIPDSVTSIGDSAFRWCQKLQSVIIPSSVTSIERSAFEYCSSLQSVTIPDSVTSIAQGAFRLCEKLESVTIPNSITSISDNTFSACTNLQSVVIPSSVTSIGEYAFGSCRQLKRVTIPSSVTSIGDRAFCNCSSLQSVTIPDSITSIGTGMFKDCSSLQSVNIPDSVTDIGENAFYHCSSLQSITIPDSVTRIPMIFEEPFPKTFADQIREWYPRMTDTAFKAYVLHPQTWASLDTDTQAEIYSKKQSKALMKFFLPLMTETLASHFATQYLEKAASSLSATDCKKIASFMVTYHVKMAGDSLQSLYEALLTQKNGKKALEEIAKDTALSAKLSKPGSKQTKLSETEKKLFDFVNAHKLSTAELTQKLKNCYGLTSEDMAPVQDTNGKAIAPLAMIYLLTAHETVSKYDGVVAQYQKAGVSPEASEIVSLLDPDSFQAALRKLAAQNLGITGHSKKMYLAYPICRYADEALMSDLTKQAPKWKSSVSGNEAPPLRTFRDANLYSETRAAILFADKYKELDRYAALRGTTADLLRDSILSDIGLSADGKKSYDLGNQTATVVLQKDLSFLFQLENGKTAKSLPKKGADPDAYAAANADFTAMKKNAKTIVKNRQTILFEEFFSGKERTAAEWKAAYTENPLLRSVASLLVWTQGENTFILTADGAITSDQTSYAIGKEPISLAHPMEMNANDLVAWQKYFVENGLKQPFEQIWEPVMDPDSLAPDRYKGCMIPYYRFTGKKKHGITVTDEDFHNEIAIEFKDLEADVERIDWERHYIDPNHRFEVKSIAFGAYTRMTNHIVAYLDRVTIYDRIIRDDASIVNALNGFTLAQITEFIRIATENHAANVTAVLLNYKNEKFPDFDPLAEFSLDFDD